MASFSPRSPSRCASRGDRDLARPGRSLRAWLLAVAWVASVLASTSTSARAQAPADGAAPVDASTAQDTEAERTAQSTGSTEGDDEDDDSADDSDEAPRRRPERVYTEEDEDYETLPEVDDPWVMQAAARTGLGFGTTLGDLRREFVWDSHLRAELMFTHRGDEHFSIGPSLELRGADFDTFEVAAGLSVLLPIARGYPIDVSAQVGYAVRRGQRFGGSAPIFVGTIAGGYRSFNFHHWWQTSLQLYAQVRMDITEPRNIAFMMGVEIDLAQAVVVPALMIRMKVRGGDPDELEDEEGDEDDEDADAADSSDDA